MSLITQQILLKITPVTQQIEDVCVNIESATKYYSADWA